MGLSRALRVKSPIVREAMAEFLGTFVLMMFGDGSVAQFVYGGKYGNINTFLTINLCWGLAVTMGIHVAGGVSGAHLNPAVSLAFSVIGKLPWWKMPIYILAQYLGAFVASGVVFGVYYEAHMAFDSNFTTPLTSSIYSTFPKDYLSPGGGVGDQMVSTALLLLCILAITDSKNMPATTGMAPLLIGFSVTAIGMSFGLNCGYAINPARDLGPRIFTAIAGWGTAPFTFNNYMWFWVPVVGPHLGGIIGAIMYLVFVGIHCEDDEDEAEAATDSLDPQGTYNTGFDHTEVDAAQSKF